MFFRASAGVARILRTTHTGAIFAEGIASLSRTQA